MNPHDNWAQYYDFVYEQTYGLLYTKLTSKTVELIETMIQSSPVENDQASILDVGAGTGRIAIPLIENGHRVTAIEPSKMMCQEMQDKIEQNHRTRLTIINKSMQDYQPALDAFNIAVCVFTVIAYILDKTLLDKAISNIARGLKTNGFLLIDIPQLILFKKGLKIVKKECEREVRIVKTQDHIYNYTDTGKGRFEGRDFSYEDNFQIRYWDDQFVINLCQSYNLRMNQNLQAVANSVQVFNWTGAKYYLFQKMKE